MGSVPEDTRVDPPFQHGERDGYEAWLDWHRATLVRKCAGLDDELLRARPVASALLSLHGLVRHMTEVERNWFRRVLAGEDAPPLYYEDPGNPDGDFEIPEGTSYADDLTTWEAEVARCREIAAAHA